MTRRTPYQTPCVLLLASLTLLFVGCRPAGKAAKKTEPARTEKVPGGLLFTVPLGPEKELKAGLVSDSLRKAFEDNHKPLPRIVSVDEAKAGGEWQIDAQGRRYVVRKAAEELKIHEGFAKVILTKAAYDRLSIESGLAAVKKHTEARTRTFGGEVIVPPGKTVIVSAPLSGTIAPPSEKKPLLTPGSPVKRDEVILRFTPILPPEAKATLLTSKLDAQRQVASAEVQLKLAELALKRAQRLSQGRAASAKIVEEAEAARDLAREAKKTAEDRSALLAKLVEQADSGQMTSLEIKSPVAGVLQKLDVTRGETVAAGEVLLEVIETDQVWVRVPVYVGHLRQFDTKQQATVKLLGPSGQMELPARYVAQPPRVANRLASSTDLYYALANDQHKLPLRPGELVSVEVTFQSAPRLTVPWSAVVYDVHGGTWVYAQVEDEERTFWRRSVEIEYINQESQAVLISGPKPGTTVVTAGAAELLGTEFAVDK